MAKALTCCSTLPPCGVCCRLEVRHDEQAERDSLYTEPDGPLRIDAYNADGGALFNDTVLVAIGGRFPRPHNVGLFSIGCAWTSISCHCFLTFGDFSSDRLVMAPRQPQIVPFTRILGRWNANFCVKDVIVTRENLPAEAILSYVRGSGSTIVLTASSTESECVLLRLPLLHACVGQTRSTPCGASARRLCRSCCVQHRRAAAHSRSADSHRHKRRSRFVGAEAARRYGVRHQRPRQFG